MTSTSWIRLVKKSLLGTAALSGLGYGVVIASTVDNFVSPEQSVEAEAKAVKAYSAKDYRKAITQGEKAVLGDPRNPSYRFLLGQANLAAGRFASAETLFSDVITLEPNNTRAALNLALTKIALGHPAEARDTLEGHRDSLSAADYGLAVALAGDPSAAIRSLEPAARSETATAKTRQNLALAYALAGRWDEAKVTAGQDLAPEMVDQRMTEWAQMSHPNAAWDQVAAVMHVTPSNDPGLPYQLALNRTAATPALAESHPAPVAPQAPMVVAASVPQDTPRFETATASNTPAVAAAEPQPVAELASVAPATPPVVAIARPRVVPVIHAAAQPAKRSIAARAAIKIHASAHLKAQPATHLAAHQAFSVGRFAVQIGSYANVALAKQAWGRDLTKLAALRRYDPAQSQIKVRAASYVRLAVTGFKTHDEAGHICAQLRAAGTRCFVRVVAGDQLATWLRKDGGPHLAAAHAKPVVKVAAKVAPHVVKPTAKPAIAKIARPAGGQLAVRR